MTVMPCGSRKNTSAASQSQTVMGPLAAITGTRLRLAMATTERKTRSQGPSARLSCGLASVVEGPAFIVDRAWRRRPPPVCEINGKDSGGGGGPSKARAAVSGCGRHLYGPVQFTRTAAGRGLPLLSQVLQARALHGEAIEHGQLFAARAAGHPTPMDLFGPVLELPIGFEIGSEKAERMQRGGRAVTIRSYAVLSIVAFFASMPTGVGLTPQTGGLCGKPPSAFWWLPLWLSNPPPTTSVSSASPVGPVGPVGPVAVSAPPISLAVRRRSWRDPPRLSCGASVGPQDLFRLPWPSAGPDRAGRVAL